MSFIYPEQLPFFNVLHSFLFLSEPPSVIWKLTFSKVSNKRLIFEISFKAKIISFPPDFALWLQNVTIWKAIMTFCDVSAVWRLLFLQLKLISCKFPVANADFVDFNGQKLRNIQLEVFQRQNNVTHLSTLIPDALHSIFFVICVSMAVGQIIRLYDKVRLLQAWCWRLRIFQTFAKIRQSPWT